MKLSRLNYLEDQLEAAVQSCPDCAAVSPHLCGPHDRMLEKLTQKRVQNQTTLAVDELLRRAFGVTL